MIVGTLELCLRLDGAFSLKDKRSVLRSLLDHARRDFRVSAAEVDDHDLWNSAVIGIACVSNDAAHAESTLQHVIDLFDAHPAVAVESALKQVERR
ncbi:MAG: DUF503 domain-containing protein [Fimbriimonas sp.]|nr:DUF503 domain-containing protein [Fimbriimonas sp.]